jgi:hypothetical protein
MERVVTSHDQSFGYKWLPSCNMANIPQSIFDDGTMVVPYYIKVSNHLKIICAGSN